MKVLGFVIIVLGIVIGYIGITGTQHNVMAILSGKTSAVPSGQQLNLKTQVSSPPTKTTTTPSSNDNTTNPNPPNID